jgi:glycosyltransferase involved in cell wall biosynthesis
LLEYNCIMLSIVIPTLNEEEHLPKLLRSIKKQRYQDYEIIIADADSKDRTVDIAVSFGCRITSGGMPGMGRNKGAHVAKGETLLFLDADAELPRKFLVSLMKEFERRNLDVAGCSLRIQNRKKIYRAIEKLYKLYFTSTQRFYPHATNCILIKKSLHNLVGGFDEEILLGEDFMYIRSASKQGTFGFIPDVYFYVSPRRAEAGMTKLALQYFLAEAYMTLLGPIKSDIFRYRFGNYDTKGDSLLDKELGEFYKLFKHKIKAKRLKLGIERAAYMDMKELWDKIQQLNGKK